MISPVSWLLDDFLSLKTDVNVYVATVINLLASLKPLPKKSTIRIQIRNPVHGSMDPDPRQNVTDPEHWFNGWCRRFV